MRTRTLSACVLTSFSVFAWLTSPAWGGGRRGEVTVTITEDHGEVVGTMTGQATDLLGSYLRCQDISTTTGCTSAVNAECSKSNHGTIKPGSSGVWDAVQKTCSGTCLDGAKVEFKCSKTAPIAPKSIDWLPRAVSACLSHGGLKSVDNGVATCADGTTGIIDEPEPTSIEEHNNGTPCVKGTEGCK